MNKFFFKYNKGYLNIDAFNLYITTTGNWSETRRLDEKSKISERSYSKKKIKTGFFYVFLFVIGSALSMKIMEKGKLVFLPMFFLFLFYFAYRSMYSESGKAIKIPIQKIIELGFTEKGVELFFINGAMEKDSEFIEGLSEEGVFFLKKMMQSVS